MKKMLLTGMMIALAASLATPAAALPTPLACNVARTSCVDRCVCPSMTFCSSAISRSLRSD